MSTQCFDFEPVFDAEIYYYPRVVRYIKISFIPVILFTNHIKNWTKQRGHLKILLVIAIYNII